jgi:hypothetical protein
MKKAPSLKAPIKKLLDRLEQKKDEEVAVTTVKGRAISRSPTNVHLATAAGIVAIPIANIKEVVSLSDAAPDLVRIVVRNPKDMRQLMGVRSAWPPAGGSHGGGGTVVKMEDGETLPTDRNKEINRIGVGTYETTDSDTITGGQGNPDATDDRDDGPISADDLQQ